MHVGYSLVAFNLLVCFIIGGIILVYKFIYPKKTLNAFSLLLICSFLPVLSIFRSGVYSSGDMVIHIERLISFYTSIEDGSFIPTWSKDLNATYGYPVFIFIYPLPYYAASLFHLIGFSYINSIKLLLFTSFIGSGIAMYIWLKERFNTTAGFIGSIFYLFAPYHLVDVNFRVDIGENLSFIFLPLIFLCIDKIFLKKKYIYIGILSIFVALLILSHQAIAIFFLPCASLYALFLFSQNVKRQIKMLLVTVASFIWGSLLTAYYWLPIIVETKFTHQVQFAQTLTFQPLYLYLFAPWHLGLLFQGPEGRLSYLVGYVQLFILAFAIILIFKKAVSHQARNNILFALLLFTSIFILTQKISYPIWNIVPILKNIQFSYRLSGILMFFMSFIAAIAIEQFNKKKFTALICILVIFITFLNWGNRQMIGSITDSSLIRNLPYATGKSGEGFQVALPIWTNNPSLWMKSIPKNHLEIQSGRGSFNTLKRTTTLLTYQVAAKTKVKLIENTLFFPVGN